jgi:hypothetical protein
MDSNKNTQNSTYYPHPDRRANVQRMRLPNRTKQSWRTDSSTNTLAWQICKTNPKLNYVRGTAGSERSPAQK